MARSQSRKLLCPIAGLKKLSHDTRIPRMITKSTQRTRTPHLSRLQHDRDHFIFLLHQLSDLAEDILEEYHDLRPEVLASFHQASKAIKQKKYREIASLTELKG